MKKHQKHSFSEQTLERMGVTNTAPTKNLVMVKENCFISVGEQFS